MTFIKRPVKNIMRSYGDSFSDLKSIISKLEEDPHIRLRAKKNMIRLGVDDRTLATFFIGERKPCSGTVVALTNIFRTHYNYPLDRYTAGVTLFLTNIATSGWFYIDDTLYEADDHYTIHLFNRHTAQNAVCHLSLNTLSFLVERNPDDVRFADIYPELV